MESSRRAATPEAATRGKAAPGHRGHWLLGTLAEVQQDPLAFVLAVAREYGPVAQTRIAWLSICWITGPEAARYVLQENHFNYDKRVPTLSFVRRIVGNGLFTSDGKFWLRQRRLVQPAFHRDRVAAFGEIMTAEELAVAERWERLARTGQPVEVGNEMMRSTLNVVNRALFGAAAEQDARAVSELMTTLLEDVTFRITNPFYPPPGVPTSRNRRFAEALRTLEAIVYRIISERRRMPRDDDLLALLLNAQDEETGEGMSDQQLRDEVTTFYLAGHETTAVALAWVWYLLSSNPDVAHRLRAELTSVLGGRPPCVADLAKLPYTLMVIQEAMRLYPPVWVTARRAIADDMVGGYRVRSNLALSVSPYAVHRDPAVWENPEDFDPERFAPERSKDRPPYAYIPFGTGPRQCIGLGFAMTEAQLVLATLAQHFAPELIPGRPVIPQPLATLRPSGDLPMIIRRAV
jgi:cytochrome P450